MSCALDSSGAGGESEPPPHADNKAALMPMLNVVLRIGFKICPLSFRTRVSLGANRLRPSVSGDCCTGRPIRSCGPPSDRGIRICPTSGMPVPSVTRPSGRTLLGAVLALPIAFVVVACGGDSSPPPTWIASWYGAPQAYNEPPLSANAAKSFQNQTFRQTMYVSQGGSALRIRVSNLLGTSPLAITSMRVAKAPVGLPSMPRPIKP